MQSFTQQRVVLSKLDLELMDRPVPCELPKTQVKRETVVNHRGVCVFSLSSLEPGQRILKKRKMTTDQVDVLRSK